jgi:hypothetical protein
MLDLYGDSLVLPSASYRLILYNICLDHGLIKTTITCMYIGLLLGDLT